MTFLQLTDQVIDIAGWDKDEEFGAIYPEGKRDKTLWFCPSPAPYKFLKAGHRYLFKLSSPHAPEQFFVEIFSYLLGVEMGVSVPPAFVAYNSKENQAGALIEWFLIQLHDSEGNELKQIHTLGGEYCQEYIPNFDRKKGSQHNFETVVKIMEDLSRKPPYSFGNWRDWWAKTFVFDALIGNTDRHQDNWGIIGGPSESLSPAFDNGTSMEYRIRKEDFGRFDDPNYLEKHVTKGRHQMKWNLTDSIHLKRGEKHGEMLQKLAEAYPETRHVMVDCLKKVNYDSFRRILDHLVLFKAPVRLTPERAAFMLKLIHFRHQKLLNELEN